MLQPVDPGRDTVDDRLERVGVGGDREAVPVRLVDQRHEVVGGELPAVDVGARGQEAAGSHHLDDVDAALRVLADGVPHPALGDPTEEVAVPARRGDRRPRRHDRGEAGAGLAQAQGEVVAVTEVAHRGDARAQLGGGGLRHRLQHGVVVARSEGGDRVEPRVEREVHVGVDQAGQQGGVAEIEHLGIGGGRAGADLGDPPVLDEHERVGVGGDAVEEAGGAEGCTGHAKRCTGVLTC